MGGLTNLHGILININILASEKFLNC